MKHVRRDLGNSAEVTASQGTGILDEGEASEWRDVETGGIESGESNGEELLLGVSNPCDRISPEVLDETEKDNVKDLDRSIPVRIKA